MPKPPEGTHPNNPEPIHAIAPGVLINIVAGTYSPMEIQTIVIGLYDQLPKNRQTLVHMYIHSGEPDTEEEHKG